MCACLTGACITVAAKQVGIVDVYSHLLTAFLAPEKESKQRILYHNMTPDHILVTLNQKVYPHHHKIAAYYHTEAEYYELMISRHGHDSAT